MTARTTREAALEAALVMAIEDSGHCVSGPTDSRAAENGEPIWTCRARAALALPTGAPEPGCRIHTHRMDGCQPCDWRNTQDAQAEAFEGATPRPWVHEPERLNRDGSHVAGRRR